MVNSSPDAERRSQAVLCVTPGAANALYRELGVIYLAAGDVQRAIRMFEKVLEFQPRSPDVQKQLRRLRKSQPG